LYSCDFIKDLKGLDAGLIETYKRLLSIWKKILSLHICTVITV
jgi:hypothetical protein